MCKVRCKSMDEFFFMFFKKDYVGNDDKVGDMLEDII